MTRISDLIIHDHQELNEQFQKIKSATDDDTKQRWANQFVWELARHSIGEEIVVYPAMAKNVPNGQQMADKDREEHQTVKELLYKFQKMKPRDTDFESTLDTLMKNLNQHIKEEESNDLPALEAAIDVKSSESLAKSFKRTKWFLPTQSHPSAPSKPPFETVAGLFAAPIDHLMDVFKKFPEESQSTLPP